MISKISYSFVIADLLHYGHVRLLKKAKEVSDYHICGLISDEACHKWQGISVSNFEERKNVLERLDCIDEIINQKSMDPTENLKLIHDNFPKAKLIVVHGDDWQSIPGKDYVKKIGGEVIQPEYYSKLSREKIIDKFRDDNNLNGFDHEYYNEHFLIGKIEHFKENKNNLISSKANTLENFKSILKKSHIEPMYVFEVEEFKNNTEKIIEEVSNKFRGEIVVRSSSHQEDNLNESKAGYFDSIIGVDSQSYQDINCAINKVIDSFDHKDKKRDQILVQKHTKKIKKSGVVFTRNIKDNSPYYFINYDDESSRTDTVTNGSVGKAVWFYKGLDVNAYPEEWKGLVSAVKEIENKIPGMVLDIEFAEKNDGTIVIFQIRPLAANVKFKSTIDDEHYDNVLNNNIQRYLESERDLYNNKRILSDMAFWNPAEIIGDNPANLDYSLYREIITSGSWNEGLIPLGYSKIAKELMEKYANKPYINVDYSFYSLTPSSLDDKITRKLINYYRNKLINDKTSHDKIEFEISFNCYTCSTENDLSELLNYNFNYEELNELKNSLKKLTINCITNYKNILDNDLRDLKKLIISSGDLSIDDTNPFNLIEKALNLLEDIKKYGTPQFSRIARLAFIANSLCKSFVKKGIFIQSEINKFMNSINTVASDFERDFIQLAKKNMTIEKFKDKYGHLRSGTYDITTLPYSEKQFNDLSSKIITEKEKFKLEKDKFKKALNELGFNNISVNQFEFFLRSAIKEREYFKFEFTKALSHSIELIAKAGDILGFDREQIKYLDVSALKASKYYKNKFDLKEFFSILIESNKEKHNFNSKIKLPPVIADEKDFKIIDSWISRPNFITDKKVIGEIVNLETETDVNLQNKIVMISKADPGYDWVFTKDIKGLITRYGGTASHMAIRSAEFDLPAAIGCGERLYKMIKKCNKIELNCSSKKILNLDNGGIYE